jgi:hypothetical protein
MNQAQSGKVVHCAGEETAIWERMGVNALWELYGGGTRTEER